VIFKSSFILSMVAVSDDMLCIKAQKYGNALNINGFSHSNGWPYGFKKRHVMFLHTLRGEGAKSTWREWNQEEARLTLVQPTEY
jgi:hypothetical protein